MKKKWLHCGDELFEGLISAGGRADLEEKDQKNIIRDVDSFVIID